MVFFMKITEDSDMALKKQTNLFYICTNTDTRNHGEYVLWSK